MDWLFPWLLLLHILGAIVAFGPTFSLSLIGAMGGKEPQHANFATRVSVNISRRRILPVALTLAVTGVGMMLVRGIDPSQRTNWWLGLAIVLYVIAIAFSLLVQMRTSERIVQLTSSPPAPGASGPPPELRAAIGRVQRGGMFLGLMIVVIVFLMVVKPQF